MEVAISKETLKRVQNNLSIVHDLQVRLRKPDFRTCDLSKKQSMNEQGQDHQSLDDASQPTVAKQANQRCLMASTIKTSHFALQNLQSNSCQDIHHVGGYFKSDGAANENLNNTDLFDIVTLPMSEKTHPGSSRLQKIKSNVQLDMRYSAPQILTRPIKIQGINDHFLSVNTPQVKLDSLPQSHSTLLQLQGDLQGIFQHHSSGKFIDRSPFRLSEQYHDCKNSELKCDIANCPIRIQHENWLQLKVLNSNLSSISKVEFASTRIDDFSSKLQCNQIDSSKTSFHVDSKLEYIELARNASNRRKLP